MSEASKDGGPAFPVWELNGQGQQEMTCFGMTMLEVFAKEAMGAMCGGIWPDADERREIAKRSWAMAEEMMKTRPA